MKDQSLMQKSVRLLALASLFVLSVTAVRASLVYEKFTTDPALDGWQAYGDTNLFYWDATNQVLDVTWDSTQVNSYYCHPLGVTLTTNDSFCVQFDLQVSNATVSAYGAGLAIGLLHFADATNAAFSRTSATATNVWEFDYYPAVNYEGYVNGDSLDASLIDSAGNYYFTYDNQTMAAGVTYHVVLLHPANTLYITGQVYTNGQLMSTLPVIENYYTPGDAGAFLLDTLSISSYQDDGWGDDIYATGTVANLACATPLPVTAVQAIAAGQVQLGSDTNWLYTLEQTADFSTWTAAAPAVRGTGTNLVLQATNVPAGNAFYRVRADLP